MNKTITIHIAGTLFNMEESAYEQLKAYINSLKAHFSKHPDGVEITNDIESRIAELFRERMQEEHRDVINEQDVEKVISQLGSVEDLSTEENDGEPEERKNTSREGYEPLRLYRNSRHAKLGGVCAGLGDYLNLDPTWIRLIWIVLIAAYGAGVFIYLVLWIVVPQAPPVVMDREEDRRLKRKRLFRVKQSKMIGGVCAGFATHFNADPTWIRLAWVVLSLCYGVGVVLYILFWIIMPKARTLADEMAMKGEPDNLDGIVRNAEEKKKNLTESQPSGITRFFHKLFDCMTRFIKAIFRFLGKTIGLVLVVFPFLATAAIIIAISMGSSDASQLLMETPVLAGWNKIVALICAAILLLVPVLCLTFWGIRILRNRPAVHRNTLYTLWIIWFIALAGATYITSCTVHEFRAEVTLEERHTIRIPENDTLRLRYNYGKPIDNEQLRELQQSLKNKRISHYRLHSNHNMQEVSVSIVESPDRQAHLIERISARGKNIEQATRNASGVRYHFTQEEGKLKLDRHFQLAEEQLWRGHTVHLILQLPENVYCDADFYLHRRQTTRRQ